MKALVFGGTGFIGSHVVEQLHLAGHQVTAVVRDSSDSTFLKSLGVNVVQIDFSNSKAIGKVIQGHDVVYNCTADTNLNTESKTDAPVEIKLTKTLIDEAALNGVSRFIQLSTIVIYDFKSNEPIDESYDSHPEFAIQEIGLERERIIKEAASKTGIETIVLRLASAIGIRDTKSFFSRLFTAYMNEQFPMVGNGDTKVSLIDTRNIGRAMEWLGTYKKAKDDNGIYLLKGFDTTWYNLMKEIERASGKVSKIVQLPTSEQSIMVNNFKVNRIWDDNKIKRLGFTTKYTLTEAVKSSVRDLLN